MKGIKVNIIAAVALNGAIGRENSLMWHISADMKFFRATTTGHPVIMGRKTFESLGRALPKRLNVVISRGERVLPEGVVLARSLDEAIEACKGCDEECFVIGGGQIYAEAMKKADTLYITRVGCSPEDADTFFPPILADEWKIVSKSENYSDEESGLQYSFEKYSRAR